MAKDKEWMLEGYVMSVTAFPNYDDIVLMTGKPTSTLAWMALLFAALLSVYVILLTEDFIVELVIGLWIIIEGILLGLCADGNYRIGTFGIRRTLPPLKRGQHVEVVLRGKEIIKVKQLETD